MKQTAMQTLIDELKDYKRTTHSDKLVITFWICMAERLLEKEKEQIINAYDLGSLSEMQYPNPKTVIENGEQYYKETFNKQDMNKIPTPINKLHSRILFNIGLDDNDIKELDRLVKECVNYEKEQLMKTWTKAIDQTQERAWNVVRAYDDFDDHYNETYS